MRILRSKAIFPVLLSDSHHPGILLDQQFSDIDPEFLIGKARCENVIGQHEKAIKTNIKNDFRFKNYSD